MLTLAFESSARAASVALCSDGELLAQSAQLTGLTHSQTLLPMAESLLENCGRQMSEVDVFAVAHGPGSFTGVRIGVSAVKGLGWALDKPVTGVSTLAAMSWHWSGLREGSLICPVMDARRSEVYNALFEADGDGMPRRLTEDRAVSLSLLSHELREMDRPVYLVGDGCRLTSEFLAGEGRITTYLPPEPMRHQSAWGVAMEAGRTQSGSAQELIPVYLRLSQAERERQARMHEQ